MLRALVAAAAALLASTAAAQAPHVPGAPPAPAAASPAAPSSAQPAAPGGANAKAVDKAKALGKREVERAAPRLGKAEKLVRKQGGNVVEKAVDLAVESFGLFPGKTAGSSAGATSPTAEPAPRR